MPSVARGDAPGTWHHVMNRGLARRVVFQGRDDIRYFLSRIARVVRRGELGLHAYSILATHFHLLVRVRNGSLSRSMQWIEHGYVRWFNRRRRRDGPLFQGRFRSKPVLGSTYWRTLLAYIDGNAVEAGLAQQPLDYPWSSAFHFARRRGPPWLGRAEVEAVVMESRGTCGFTPEHYVEFTRGLDPVAARWVVGRRHGARDATESLELDDLVRAAPPSVAAWMCRRARLADGTRADVAIAAPSQLIASFNRHAAVDGGHAALGAAGCEERPRTMLAGLLRSCCGLRFHEIARRIGGSPTTMHDLVTAHRYRLEHDADYAIDVGSIASAAIRATFGVSATEESAAAIVPVGVRKSP